MNTGQLGSRRIKMNRYRIDNVKIDIPDSINEIQDVFDGLVKTKRNIVSFINPEIFMAVKKEVFLYEYMDNTQYNFVDGIGLLKAVNFYYKKNLYTINDRYPGTDFFLYLNKNKVWRVFLYGASFNNNRLAKRNIISKYSNIEIVGNVDGYNEEVTESDIINRINESRAEILIVCLGCPKQEKWIYENIDRLDVNIILGNGGSIDFWSDKVKRAPEFWIKHNMEWFYRLIQDFSYKRIKRQFKLLFFCKNIITKKYKVESAD